jgi:hypothetical protein
VSAEELLPLQHREEQRRYRGALQRLETGNEGSPRPHPRIPFPRLKGDAEARQLFLAHLASRPASDAALAALLGKEDIVAWTWRVAHGASLARDYETAAGYMQTLVDHTVSEEFVHLALSVHLGKAGRLAEAEAEARRALELKGDDAWHPSIVLACWEYKLGKRSEALARMGRVRMPDDTKEHRSYYGNLAAFAAICGDEQQLETAVSKAKELDGSDASLTFFRRDVLFDPYRAKPWFIKLVGETLESR